MNVLNGIEKIKVGQVWRLQNGDSVRILATDKIPNKDDYSEFVIVGLQLTENGEEIGCWNITGGHTTSLKELQFVKLAQSWDNLKIDEPCYALVQTKIANTTKEYGYYHFAGISDEERPRVFIDGRASWNSIGKIIAIKCRPLNDKEKEKIKNRELLKNKKDE